MRKPLYLKFVLGYLLFAVVSFLFIATASARMTYLHCLDKKADELRDMAIRISESCSGFYKGSTDGYDDFFQPLTQLALFSDTRIWFIDPEGTLAYDSAGILTDTTVEDFDPNDTDSPYRTGTFYDTLTEKSVSVSAAITGNFQTYGYVVVHQPLSQISRISDGMLIPIYLTFLVIFAISLIILVIFRYCVAQPLKAITQGAKEYAAGNLKYTVKVDSDDEMGYLADTLNFMAHELNNSEEYQKKFIANVSHDFRSPLTSIKGYLEAMADGVIPPENQEKYLRIVISETERLNKLTQGLLSLNSLDRANLHLDKSDFDINTIIKSTCETFEGICGQKGITFDLTFPDVTTMVCADMGKIQQVLYNLVDNAIKFSPENSSIAIQVSEKNDKVFVSVKDFGVGIPKENLKKIWTRFFKSDESRGKDKRGTGLGLSIVREIIQAHQETIDVISTEGAGTEFIFRLPKAL
ncbi:HAMP domain-containing histidine kinase [Cuneatibacter sp. NSJ-177]|uniref:HAMP domain-containing sensor histidine kinase n=1 Tax=Cuneatibacter sp. NSJ-177 TaxID=2931401 RepID=UPI001FCFDC5E|nr:HAMP domain-containing sensor histidine kinase [Cuneatibacter sp. NSJ-177]MCJ7834988.1 HAMP domain-containing histidine kinase [Cuneatibacter sp. NSJ-177]